MATFLVNYYGPSLDKNCLIPIPNILRIKTIPLTVTNIHTTYTCEHPSSSTGIDPALLQIHAVVLTSPVELKCFKQWLEGKGSIRMHGPIHF